MGMIRQERKRWRWSSQWPSQFMQAPQIILWNHCVLCLPFPFLIWNNFSSCAEQLQFLILVLRDLLEILPESGDLMPDKLHDDPLRILFEMLFPNTSPQSLEHMHPKFLQWVGKSLDLYFFPSLPGDSYVQSHLGNLMTKLFIMNGPNQKSRVVFTEAQPFVGHEDDDCFALLKNYWL